LQLRRYDCELLTHKTMGTLYLVSTPIGNLEDITLRGVRILHEVTLIAAEDTRHTQRLLKRYDIQTPCISYHEHNKLTRLNRVLDTLAEGDVALVSDAGTPAISDPGFELVNACIAAGFPVLPIPGPSAPVSALVISGLPTDRFLYVGFLPRRSSERRALLTELAPLSVTLICFEAPHRLVETLTDALEILGDRRIAVAKDLTKLHEMVLRTDISQAQVHFTTNPPRGEFTLVIAGREHPEPERQRRQPATTITAAETAPATDEAAIAERLHALRDQGQSGSAAARTVARELGLQKSEVYQIWLKLFAD